MKLAQQSLARRRGAVVPLMAILMIPLLAMVAFAVDVGRITMTTAELQDAADSAALAGADQLMNGYVQYSLFGTTAAAQDSIVATYTGHATSNAIQFAAMNRNADLASVTLLSPDIEYGYTDGNYNYTAGSTTAPVTVGTNQYFPNTITVMLRRDTTAGGNPQLTLYFGGALGLPKTNVFVSARAVILNGKLASLPQGGFLPLAFDYNAWNQFVYAQNPSPSNQFLSNPQNLPLDQLVTSIQNLHYPITSSTFSGNGQAQLQVYPSPNLAPGNFGWISLNNSSVDSASLKNWINNGLSANDIRSLTAPFTFTASNGVSYTDNLYPIKASDVTPGTIQHDTALFDWQGITGLKDSDMQQLTQYVGKVAYLPLFSPAALPGANKNAYVASLKNEGPYDPLNNGGNGGAGTNSFYNIVDYIGITLTTVDTQGSGKGIQVQPGAVMPRGATFINPAGDPAGSAGFSYSFLPPKLSPQ
jgi:Flp pilus assembly protein TadG